MSNTENHYTRTNIDNMTSTDLIERIDIGLRKNPNAKIIFKVDKYKMTENGPKIIKYSVDMPHFKYTLKQMDKVKQLKKIMKCCKVMHDAKNAIRLITMLYINNINDYKLKYTQIPTARESDVLKFIIDDVPNL